MTPENKNINGAGLEHFSSIIKEYVNNKNIPNATTVTVGGLTVRLNGNTLYIRNDGGEA